MLASLEKSRAMRAKKPDGALVASLAPNKRRLVNESREALLIIAVVSPEKFPVKALTTPLRTAKLTAACSFEVMLYTG